MCRKETSVEVTTTAQTQGETQKQESGTEGKETAVEETKNQKVCGGLFMMD